MAASCVLPIPGFPGFRLGVSLGPDRDSDGLRLSAVLIGPPAFRPTAYFSPAGGWSNRIGTAAPGPREALSCLRGLPRPPEGLLEAACSLLSDPASLFLSLEVVGS